MEPRLVLELNLCGTKNKRWHGASKHSHLFMVAHETTDYRLLPRGEVKMGNSWERCRSLRPEPRSKRHERCGPCPNRTVALKKEL